MLTGLSTLVMSTRVVNIWRQKLGVISALANEVEIFTKILTTRTIRNGLVNKKNNVVSYLVNVNSGIMQRVHELIHKLAGSSIVVSGRLSPRMAAGPRVSRRNNELAGTGETDGVDGGLIVPQKQIRGLLNR